MSGSKAGWFRRNVLHRTPLYKRADCGNYHPIWARLCFCNVGEHWGLKEAWYGAAASWHSWHGGVRDLKTGEEYIPFQAYLTATRTASQAEKHNPDPDGLCFCRNCSLKNEAKKADAIATHMTRMDCEVFAEMYHHLATSESDKEAALEYERMGKAMDKAVLDGAGVPASILGDSQQNLEFRYCAKCGEHRGHKPGALQCSVCDATDAVEAHKIEELRQAAFAAVESRDIKVKHFFVGPGQGVPEGEYRVGEDGKAVRLPLPDEPDAEWPEGEFKRRFSMKGGSFKEKPAFVDTPADRIAILHRFAEEHADSGDVVFGVPDEDDEEDGRAAYLKEKADAGLRPYAKYPLNPRSTAVRITRGRLPEQMIE